MNQISEEKFLELMDQLNSGQITEAQFLDYLSSNGEKELSQFFAQIGLVRGELNVSDKLAEEILAKLDPNTATEEQVGRFQYRVSGRLLSKMHFHMPNIIKIALPVALVVIVAILIVTNPFNKEASQVAEIKDIGQDENSLISVLSGISSYLDDEKKLSEIDSALADLSQLDGQLLADNFDLASISSEENNVGFDQGLTDFFNQEQGLSEVDAALANF